MSILQGKTTPSLRATPPTEGNRLRQPPFGIVTIVDEIRAHTRAALNISYVAAAWSLLAGVVSVIIGWRAGSTALIGTGTDVLADMASSIVLIWRFQTELSGKRPGHEVEQRAQVVAALALLVVAAGVAIGAITRLLTGHGASPEISGIVVAAVSVVVLPVLAVVKLRIATNAGSRALRTDALITLVGAATAALSLIGLLLTQLFHWSAADPVAALLIALLAGFTGARELWDATHSHVSP